MSTRFPLRLAAPLTAILFSLACGGGKEAGTPAPGAPPAAPQPAAAAPTGKIITIELITDETGNYFKPKEVEAHPGDVLRFTLTVGVHNVHFLADSNPGVPNLPAASELLQLPGQTVDVPVTFAPGKTYYFQCDPHAALGMRGHVKVEAEE
jgi:plastocyanin